MYLIYYSFICRGGLPIEGTAVVREAVDAEWDEIHTREGADGVHADGANGADAAGVNGEGVNADGARNMGVRGANMDWGANTGVHSGWSKGQGERRK